MKTRIFRRSLIAVGVLAAGVALAPSAFAHGHVSIGLGFYAPGVSVGINNGYYSRPYYPAYYGPTYYAPTYYAPAPVYYDPYPAYGTVYYGGGYYHRGWGDRDDWRGRDRDDHHWRDRDDRGDGGHWHH